MATWLQEKRISRKSLIIPLDMALARHTMSWCAEDS